jgi:hypothetical protein
VYARILRKLIQEKNSSRKSHVRFTYITLVVSLSGSMSLFAEHFISSLIFPQLGFSRYVQLRKCNVPDNDEKIPVLIHQVFLRPEHKWHWLIFQPIKSHNGDCDCDCARKCFYLLFILLNILNRSGYSYFISLKKL